ncbi:MAG: NAD(P)-dependent oxidoreductase [Pseudomonadota bacterium]
MDDQTPILVTGAAGCIGAWTVAHLVRAERPVVAFDRSSDRRRLYLALSRDEADAVPWETGDITEAGVIDRLVTRHAIGGLVHLAALQIPFCQADPVAGAMVNVAGTVAVFETVRRHGLNHFVYASSVAAQSRPGFDGPNTLYGVYKLADEGIGRIYWQDWEVPSIGIRPHTVFGPGRDQGFTSAPTKAMLAAAAGQSFAMPYNGVLRMQHVHEVAAAVVRCVDHAPQGAFVGDLEGEAASVVEIVAAVRDVMPGAQITVPDEAASFATDQSDADLRAIVGDWPRVSLRDGTRMTIEAFQDLLARGLIAPQPD